MSDVAMRAASSDRRVGGVAYAMVAVIVLVAIAACFYSNKVGYDSGFRTAYASEHSHYLFEKSRGDKMHKRISVQQKCVATMTSRVPPVADGGFAGIGEMMNALGLLFGGSVRCDREAGFGAVTPDQYGVIMGRSRAR